MARHPVPETAASAARVGAWALFFVYYLLSLPLLMLDLPALPDFYGRLF